MDFRFLRLQLIQEAIESRNINKIRLVLLEDSEIIKYGVKYDVNVAEDTLLWSAMLLGYEEIVELLIESGANVNEIKVKKEDEFDEKLNSLENLTFLHWISVFDPLFSRVKIAEILIQNGADINVECKDNECPFTSQPKTPLWLAVEQGNANYVEFLLKNGASLSRMTNKISPIEAVLKAPITKRKNTLQALLKNGLDVKFRDSNGNGLLQQLAFSHDGDHHDLVEIAQTLLDDGTPVNEVNHNGLSLLHYNSDDEDAALISFLITKGLDINLKESDGDKESPLHAAVVSGAVTKVHLLLSNGADVNAQTTSGETALHYVCGDKCEITENCELIIQLLIWKGAEISTKNRDGKSPFSLMSLDHVGLEAMIREFSKLSFGEIKFCAADMDKIQSEPELKKYFEKCKNELFQMKNTTFYSYHCAPYSNYSILNMSTRKLARLANNGEFVVEFKKNLSALTCYKNDLLWAFSEAVRLKFETSTVYFKLLAIFGDYLTDDNLKKLAVNLKIDDLLAL